MDARPQLVGLDELRVEPDGLGEVGERAAVVAGAEVGVAAVGVNHSIRLTAAYGRVEVGDRLWVLLLVKTDAAAQVERPAFGRIEPDRLVRVGQRLGVVAPKIVHLAPAEEYLGRLGIDLQ